jgi:GNAT superfamily N-acetyltransferase
MAVDDSAQGKGLGKKIMLAAEQNARMLGYAKMMLQARENAIPFYLSLGYIQKEKTHLLFDEIQHWRMEKGI